VRWIGPEVGIDKRCGPGGRNSPSLSRIEDLADS